MIQLKTYSITNLTLTNSILTSYINLFWTDIFSAIKNDKHLMLMCKVEFTDETMGYRTLGNLRKVNFDDKELFIDYLSERLSILNESYITIPINKISFSYIVKSGLCTDDDRALLQDLTEKSFTFHNFNNMNLPVTMIPSEYGEIRSNSYVQVNGESIERFIVKNGNKFYEIDVNSNTNINKVTLLGNIDLKWIDTLLSVGSFKREIGKSTIYFMDDEIVLRKQQLPAKAFKVLKTENKIITDFFTLDIEAFKDSLGRLVPYLICAYNGKEYISSYTQDQTLLFKKFFDQLLTKIKVGSINYIYAHNLSGFDGIFLMKHLINFGKVSPLIHNGKIISIKVTISGSSRSKNITLVFKFS